MRRNDVPDLECIRGREPPQHCAHHVRRPWIRGGAVPEPGKRQDQNPLHRQGRQPGHDLYRCAFRIVGLHTHALRAPDWPLQLAHTAAVRSGERIRSQPDRTGPPHRGGLTQETRLRHSYHRQMASGFSVSRSQDGQVYTQAIGRLEGPLRISRSHRSHHSRWPHHAWL